MISLLYVDDEPALLDAGSIFLERSGELLVTTVTGGREALQLLESRHFDAIVSDYQMPEMDGIELLKEVRRLYPDLPFILFTGKGREEIVIQAINNGVDFYLQKGGDPKVQFAELEHKIRQAIRRRTAEEDRRLTEKRLDAMIQLYAMRDYPLKDITDYALEQAVIITQSTLGYLAFLTDDERVLLMYSWSKQAMDECRIQEKPREYPVEKTGLWGEAVRQRRAIITNNYSADNPLKKGTPPGHVRLQRHMNVPIFDGNRIVIVVGVGNKLNNYDEDDILQLSLLMNGLWGIIRRKRVEEALHKNLDELAKNQKDLAESRQMLRSVLDTIPVRVFWKDRSLHYLGCNLPFAKDAGYQTPADIIGKTDYEMGWADQAEMYRADDKVVIESGNPKYNYEEPQTTPEGKRIWLRTSKIPLRNTDGELLGVLGTYEDITEAKRIQGVITGKNEELQAAYQQLSATDKTLRENYRQLLEHQAALKENEEKYRNLFEAESDAVLLIDNETGAILEANNAATALYGYSKDEILSRKNTDLSAEPEDTERVTRTTPVLADRVVTIPLRYHKKRDGTVFPVEITGRFFNWGGRPVHVAAIRDITERQQAAEARQGRADRAVGYQKALVELATTDAPTLRIALNRITEMGSRILNVDRVSIWFFSKDGESLTCNDLYIGSISIHEYGREINRKDYPRYFSALQDNRAIVAKDTLTHEQTFEFKKEYFGQYKIVSALYIPIRTGLTVVGVLCFEETKSPRSWDIEDQDYAIALADYTAIVLEQARRRLAEKDLRKSEEKYRTVINRANEGIVILQEGILQFVNPRAAELLGGSPEILNGRSFYDFVAPAEREKVRAMQLRRMEGEDVPSVFETILISRDNVVINVELNAGIMDYNGKSSDIIFIRDVSDRKRSEQSLRLANEKLNLLSNVTRHDILNKLTIAIGYLELAKLTHEREKLEDFIRKIDATLHVMEDQIMFTRDYQDMGVKDPEWQDASETFDLAVSQLDTGKVQITNNLSGLTVLADPLLGKVMYNIIDNSLRYGQNLTSINASYRREGSTTILLIEDDGIGIPAKDKSKIFEKGFGHHTGLGLFLAKEILSLTGIEIMETGFPTKGARFELHIPAGRFRISEST
ncbi:MAG: aerobic respiration control sensor protein ArcB [Methanoregula sp. PtaU1.Bin051]|nr:MAG: aerobic respiration control sensor protein ArcB [Methanoregula sp. PtaU1.Bin051]